MNQLQEMHFFRLVTQVEKLSVLQSILFIGLHTFLVPHVNEGLQLAISVNLAWSAALDS